MISPTDQQVFDALANGPVIAKIVIDRAYIDAQNPWSGLTQCWDTEDIENAQFEEIWVNIVGYHYKPWNGQQLWRVKFPFGP